CELYYSLLGGTVDYGEEHSSTHRYSRYGRTFSNGLYPVWSKEKSLHFLGHSGRPTVIKLHDLLWRGQFGDKAHPDMILSLNAVCAPFRGTQLVCALGESLTDAPVVRPFSIGAFLARLVHIVAYYEPLLRVFLMSMRMPVHFRSAKPPLLRSLSSYGEWAELKDTAQYDMTFEVAETRAECLEGRVHPTPVIGVMSLSWCVARALELKTPSPRKWTYYAQSLSKPYQHQPPMTFSFTHILLYIPSTLIGIFDYHLLRPSLPFSQTKRLEQEIFRDSFGDGQSKTENIGVPEGQVEEYLANDGVVPVFSQWHPLPCA
ncbi:LOW QUALITY PROTEIN: hypothetical protein CVT25_005790, partial [Psilocybe cyanescens]